MVTYCKIKISPERDQDLTKFAKRLLKDYYLLPTEHSPQDAFARAASAYCFGDYALAQRVYDYASKGWFMFASPVLSNAPKVFWPEWSEEYDFETIGEWLGNNQPKGKGLPISCFLTYCADSVDGITTHEAELRALSVHGGGVGSHYSAVRSLGQVTSRGARTPGIIPFLHCIDSSMLAFHQGTTRRGNTAVYLDISHPEIKDFISMRIPSGDINRQNLNLHHGVNISGAFLRACDADTQFDLVDPSSGIVTDTVSARKLWTKLLRTRYRTGEPYLNFIDKATAALPDGLRALGLNGSNLCNEIHLPTGPDRTAVCCLSSVNLDKYDAWKDTSMVRDLIRFLDNVMEYFIRVAPATHWRAVRSATLERSLGLGAMGFHSLLQRRGIPFESALAVSLNRELFQYIKGEAVEETKLLAGERGVPADARGVRNCHLLAVAPNSNSSLILNVSPSIEPWKANVFEKSTRAGSSIFRNTALAPYLSTLDVPESDSWRAILSNAGSVANLGLEPYILDVFKTANEIDQRWVVDHASVRQEWICQGQSLNLFFAAKADLQYIHDVHWRAAQKNIKGLYYLRTDGGSTDDITKPVEATDGTGTEVQRRDDEGDDGDKGGGDELRRPERRAEEVQGEVQPGKGREISGGSGGEAPEEDCLACEG